LSSLLLFYFQTQLMQKQQYAAVLPYLELWNTGTENPYSLVLANNGIGPAFIQSFEIHYKGKIYPLDPSNFLGKEMINKDTTTFKNVSLIYSNLMKGQLIPAGKEIKLITVENSEKVAKKVRELFGGNQAKLTIIFSSVYEEKWITNGIGSAPQRIK
jgi:hypothetical protein